MLKLICEKGVFYDTVSPSSSPCGGKNFVFTTSFRPDLGSTYPMVTGGSFPGDKVAGAS
jgi:hypothetical protein